MNQADRETKAKGQIAMLIKVYDALGPEMDTADADTLVISKAGEGIVDAICYWIRAIGKYWAEDSADVEKEMNALARTVKNGWEVDGLIDEIESRVDMMLENC